MVQSCRPMYICIFEILGRVNISGHARRAGSDGSMSASGPAGPGFDPRQVVNFNFKIFNLGDRRGGDVQFLIARLYITGLD